MIIAQNKPELLDTIRNEGVGLKQRGRHFWACCPFHNERTASFKVDPERQSFYCFSCGAKGDSIGFVQRLKGLSFKDACNYLGISTGKPSPEALRAIKQQREKAELIREFRAWCNDYHSDLCDLYRGLQDAKDLVKTPEDAELLSWAYHREPFWIHQLDILESRNDKQKYHLYCEVCK